ncbi:phage shock protein A (IM30), suppresses sigma54-dependent transcription [Rubidibacter lacunae KORDI 51-2]|uniref:Phage shock protein A (IM30), suppresses sigma54-dependent transcription n=1 Tax=Rubidibacter lacunae KORDI 51-2 TaxID=582515 RepID=U5DFS3_9CHRO|nr:PspA/IM30 family protein [Rubidibacter lacunae]ERN40097.1 phage shock protein A (IM30), suppresses sigma54-dependent transcription [Rubidibacter lacunae KORDI 51-2]
MGLFDRLGRVVRANLNDLVSQAEDPEKILEQAVIDMGEDLVQLRKATAEAIGAQKRTQQQYEQNQSEAAKWHQRAQLALTKGDENLAREALQRKKTAIDAANMLKQQLDQQSSTVDGMRRNLIALEGKISEAKTKKNMYKARLKAAEANKRLQAEVGTMGTGSALAAFERMEERVLSIEAESQAAQELGGMGIEQQFAQLEAGSDVDDELSALKAQMLGGAEPAGALPQASATSVDAPAAGDLAIDAELADLRAELDDIK